MAGNAQGYLVYNFSYLTLYPDFNCFYQDGSQIPVDSDDYDNMCKPSYFCEADTNLMNIKYTVNWEGENSLYNWISKYDLNCASHLTISSFGMLYFGGFAVGSTFWPR